MIHTTVVEQQIYNRVDQNRLDGTVLTSELARPSGLLQFQLMQNDWQASKTPPAPWRRELWVRIEFAFLLLGIAFSLFEALLSAVGLR